MNQHISFHPTTHSQKQIFIYVDDILIFAKSETSCAEAIKDIFKTMAETSRLVLSNQKWKVFYGGGFKNAIEISKIPNIMEGELPIQYLDVPLTCTNLRDKDCTSLIKRIKSKIEGWESKLISMAGRFELISILFIS